MIKYKVKKENVIKAQKNAIKLFKERKEAIINSYIKQKIDQSKIPYNIDNIGTKTKIRFDDIINLYKATEAQEIFLNKEDTELIGYYLD